MDLHNMYPYPWLCFWLWTDYLSYFQYLCLGLCNLILIRYFHFRRYHDNH